MATRAVCKSCMTEHVNGVHVLHRDADLLVLYKPAGIATTSPDGRNCLTELAAQLDPRAPRLHASSRLDAEVTGVVTFARTTRAIEGLLAARREGRYERYYLGLATGPLQPAAGELDWPIDRDPRDPRKRVALERAAHSGRKGRSTAQEARTRYRVLSALPSAALLLLSPLTGRTHQLRVHVARAGVPLLGDRHYGGPVKSTLPDGRVVRAGRVMLHCARVRLPRFDAADMLTLDAPIPDDFRAVWLGLGGTAADLDDALAST
jgi:23S rRNA-/tRNA-specific pseudouridylate synthase